MKRKKLLWQLFPSLWIITIIALVAVTIYFSHTFEKLYLDNIVRDLQSKAFIIRNIASDKFFAADSALDSAAGDDLVRGTDIRLTVISPAGQVIYDSQTNPQELESHAERPEIKLALEGKTGVAIRYSQTVHLDLMYVAVPVYHGENIIGAIRLSVPISEINQTLTEVYWKVAFGGLAIVILIIFTGIFISKQIGGALDSMKLVTLEFARGNFSYRLPDHESSEIGGLADAMNEMAVRIDERINSVMQQRNEQQAVLLSMVEGVMAVDLDEKVINLNRAAESMLQIAAPESIGKYIYEVVRNTQIQNFVKRVLDEHKDLVEDEIVLAYTPDIYLQAHGTALRDADGQNIGAVIVLNDISRLHQLENMRRDFVANVSHELRTPITSIKGFVETLRDGAVNNPEDAKKFLNIVIKQAERLNGIIEDLLSLSRIEEREEKSEIPLQNDKIKPVLKGSIQVCELQSSVNKVTIELNCDDDLQTKINSDLLQQAVVNLLNNAIKYSPQEGVVKVEASIVDETVQIRVIDNGPGIPPEHHQRLFERFYRVDKERSRKLGGTGLGLAIVKHIVSAHHGTVDVDSVPGEGSTFYIILPKH